MLLIYTQANACIQTSANMVILCFQAKEYTGSTSKQLDTTRFPLTPIYLIFRMATMTLLSCFCFELIQWFINQTRSCLQTNNIHLKHNQSPNIFFRDYSTCIASEVYAYSFDWEFICYYLGGGLYWDQQMRSRKHLITETQVLNPSWLLMAIWNESS